ARTMEVMGADVMVVRHSAPGAAQFLAENLKASILNAGDGAHAHPTQALLDLYTIKEKKGEISGLTVLIIGDIAHSRVARSDILGFSRMGASVRVAGPPTMIPPGIDRLGASVAQNVDEAVTGADVIIMLRIQKERQKRFLFPSEREYSVQYGLNAARLAKLKPDALIMHPGPINRGVEICQEAADGPFSVILDQVTNGVALRMALYYLVSGGIRDADAD
ncbi:MAG: aspartate carbamoyltransferase catalytic subunit, partial [bacterium]